MRKEMVVLPLSAGMGTGAAPSAMTRGEAMAMRMSGMG
jgi:hypothetical protein